MSVVALFISEAVPTVEATFPSPGTTASAPGHRRAVALGGRPGGPHRPVANRRLHGATGVRVQPPGGWEGDSQSSDLPPGSKTHMPQRTKHAPTYPQAVARFILCDWVFKPPGSAGGGVSVWSGPTELVARRIVATTADHHPEPVRIFRPSYHPYNPLKTKHR